MPQGVEEPHKSGPIQARRRLPRKAMDGPIDRPDAPREGAPPPRHDAGPPRYEAPRHDGPRPGPAGTLGAPSSQRPALPPGGLRLDDLYRLPMPKLFALAETRRHRRTHRHEPRPAHRRRRPPADRTRRNRSRLRHPRSPARRLRLPPQRRPQLSGLAGRHLRLAQPDPPPRPAHRPGRRRADPPADRGPGQLRPDAGRDWSTAMPPEEKVRPTDVRGPDAAASEQAAGAGNHRRGAGRCASSTW